MSPSNDEVSFIDNKWNCTLSSLPATQVLAPRGIARLPATADESRPFALYSVALMAMIAVLPLGFTPLQAIGLPFLKPPQIALALVVAFAPFMLPGNRQATALVKTLSAIFLARAAILLVSLTWSSFPIDGLILLVADLVGFVAAVLLLLTASRLSLRETTRVLVWGAFGSAVLLHLVIFLGHAMAGRFGLQVLLDAMFSGELKQLKSSYFVHALSGLGVQGAASLFSEVAPKATNAFGSAVVIPAVAAFHLAAADRAANGRASVTERWAMWIVVLNAVFCIVMSFSSRVQALAGLLLLIHFLYFGFLQGDRRLRFVIAFVFALAVGVGLIFLADDIVAKGGIVEFVDDFLDDPRFNDLRLIFARLGEVGFFGGGLGERLGFQQLAYLYPHNLFMADYLAAGGLGLLASVLWLGFMVWVIAKCFRIIADRRSTPGEERVALGAICAMAYAISLTQLAAQGQFDLTDWTSFALGLVLFVKALRLRDARIANQRHAKQVEMEWRMRADQVEARSSPNHGFA